MAKTSKLVIANNFFIMTSPINFYQNGWLRQFLNLILFLERIFIPFIYKKFYDFNASQAAVTAFLIDSLSKYISPKI
jgi:hypothetical protein